jgi:O-antigen ligase
MELRSPRFHKGYLVNDNSSRTLIVVSVVLCLVTFVVALLQPAYLGEYFYLGALVFVEVMLVALWGYARRFFPVLIGVFLWAGIDVPMRDLWVSRRWFVLAIAAIAGFAIYIRERRHSFSGFHLAALTCVLSAVISALVSSYPQTAVLKALSLFLLFIYAATGARLAVMGREGKFFFGLLFGCELTVWIAAVSYFILRHALFGNPNSLGAVFGVAILPLLLWGTFVSQQPALYRRRTVAFFLGLLLIFSSYSRAGIAAAVISSVVLCVCLGKYRLLIKGSILGLMTALLIATVMPISSAESGSLLQFVYKGEQKGGLLASRNSVWDRTVTTIQQRPWFGTGFGTMATDYDTTVTQMTGFDSGTASQEHGNSYLAIVEWVGLLGVIPFLTLVLIVMTRTAQVLIWLRRTGNPFSPAVPIAVIMIAGLVHAGFEDWLFAVGYYLCVFFWSMAFILIDLVPSTVPSLEFSSPVFDSQSGNLNMAMPGR